MVASALRDRGVTVRAFYLNESPKVPLGSLSQFLAASDGDARRIGRLQQPVVHLNNVYHRLSPLGFRALANWVQETGTRAVWTQHDGNSLAPDALLTTRGRGGYSLPTSPLAALQPHVWDAGRLRSVAKWARWMSQARGRRALAAVCTTVVPCDALRVLLETAGWPGSVRILPNPLDPGQLSSQDSPAFSISRENWVYVGSVTEAKGLPHLLNSGDVQFLNNLVVVGDGPGRVLEQCARSVRQRGLKTRFLGRLSRADSVAAIARSGGVVVPTLGFESSSLVVGIALEKGVSVLASRMLGTASTIGAVPGVALYDSLDPEATRLATCGWKVPDQRAVGEGRHRGSFVPLEEHIDQLLGIYTGAPLAILHRSACG